MTGGESLYLGVRCKAAAAVNYAACGINVVIAYALKRHHQRPVRRHIGSLQQDVVRAARSARSKAAQFLRHDLA
jgi:hypothetical protein